MSQRFSPRLFHCDQRGVHWLWQPGPSARRHMMTERGPDGNLCCALKDGSAGDYQGSEELFGIIKRSRCLGESTG